MKKIIDNKELYDAMSTIIKTCKSHGGCTYCPLCNRAACIFHKTYPCDIGIEYKEPTVKSEENSSSEMSPEAFVYDWLDEMIKEKEERINRMEKDLKEKMESKRIQAECDKAAREAKRMYDAFIAVGFDKDQAFAIMIEAINSGLKQAK